MKKRFFVQALSIVMVLSLLLRVETLVCAKDITVDTAAETQSFAPESSGSEEATNVSTSTTQSEEEAVYPSWSHEYTDQGSAVSVKIDAPEGAFPEGIQVSITKVSSAKLVDSIKEASESEDVTAEDIVAFDFDFYKDDVHQIGPKKPITVSFENLSIKKDAQVSAYHLEDEDASATKVAVDSVDKFEGTVEFKADTFTIYAVMVNPPQTDGRIWINDDKNNTYESNKLAVEAANSGDTIHSEGVLSEIIPPVSVRRLKPALH